jgi:phosphoglycerate dehydrogenase-like enzyme
VRILFCGNCFPASHSLLRERLRASEDEIAVCKGANLRESLSQADVVIPMMTILNKARMESGSFRLIQRWGSGLEGVDLAAARARGIWVAMCRL